MAQGIFDEQDEIRQENAEHAGMMALAEVIHNARWPEDRQLAVTPFADEDRSGREYCMRIARAVMQYQSR